MFSMTGYGSSLSKGRDIELEVQVRSVNSRFLDLRIHLPREYLSFEGDLKKKIAKLFRRGCVDVFVQRRPKAGDFVAPVKFNKGQAKEWLESIRSLKKTLSLKDEIHVRDLLGLPHIFEVSEQAGLGADEENLLKKTVEAALKSCQKSRNAEGAELQREILQLLGALGDIVKNLLPWRDKVQAKIEQRLTDRLSEIRGQTTVDPARVAVETALQLDKMDIREELVRLGEHVRVCADFAKSEESLGKKLDFYAQELLREVNTVGSKMQFAEMTELVVQAKTIIENFREQVQNVE